MKVNQRCRVYGRFLTEARKGGKGVHTSAKSLQTLHSVCAINTGNDKMSHSPPQSFVYANK